jgi:hypothetical protein
MAHPLYGHSFMHSYMSKKSHHSVTGRNYLPGVLSDRKIIVLIPVIFSEGTSQWSLGFEAVMVVAVRIMFFWLL